MKWSWRIGEFAGIGVYIHLTFLLLVAWFGLMYWLRSSSVSALVEGVGFILVLFGCVVMHEFGHALAARRYGIQTRDITLLPIGGVARLERMPEEPRQELWVALAGPLVNVAIVVVLFAYLQTTAGLSLFGNLTLTTGSFVERVMLANVSLVLFNLIPAFPMDGGRVLRALLASRLEYTQATNVAATIGQGIALLFGFVGLFVNPMLIFVALFVWIGAAQESSMIQMRSALGGIPVRRAMLTHFRTLTPTDPLTRAVDFVLTGSEQDFPVSEDGRIVGVLTRNSLLAALAQGGQANSVGSVMQREFQVADAYEMLDSAFARLQECHCHSLPVTQHGVLVGLLTADNVGEFLMVQSALAKARSRGLDGSAAYLKGPLR